MSKVAPGPTGDIEDKAPPRPARPSRKQSTKQDEERPPNIDTKDLGSKASNDQEKRDAPVKGELKRKLSDKLKAAKVTPNPPCEEDKDLPATPTSNNTSNTRTFLEIEGEELLKTNKINRKRNWKEFLLACCMMCGMLVKSSIRRLVRFTALVILLSQTVYLPGEFMLIDWLDQDQK